MIDVAISSTRVITPGGSRKAVVLIRDGKIIDVPEEFPEGNYSRIDLGELVVMPGIVDPHVHINEPGRTEWEGFDTATKAAMAGGITSLVDMPLNSSPVTTTVKAFEQKLDAARGKIHTNCGFWGGIIPGNENEIKGLAKKAVLGFKAFLTHSGIDEFPNVSETDLRKAMPIIAQLGLPLLVHCELVDDLVDQGRLNTRDYAYYLASRPRRWEDNAIAMMIRLCEEFNCRTHIVHLSSSDSLEQIDRAKQKGLPLTVETAQHYLYFQAEKIKAGQTQFKCAPPIRENSNRLLLWEALKSGLIDFVATDHSPSPPSLKKGDFMKDWGGISSLQFALPVLWTGGSKQGCRLEDISKWLSEKPSILPGLDSKGKIEKGFDADLVVWDPEKKFTVSEGMVHHKHKNTAYLHEELFGVVSQTWIGGIKVCDEGKFLHLNKGQLITTNE